MRSTALPYTRIDVEPGMPPLPVTPADVNAIVEYLKTLQ